MYWTVVFFAVALIAAPFAATTTGAVGVTALSVTGVFAVLALGAAAEAVLARGRRAGPSGMSPRP